MSTGFIAATGQEVLVYVLLASFIGGAALSWIWREHAENCALCFAGGLIIALLSFVLLCVVVRCPRCRTRLFWRAVRSRPLSGWLMELLLARRYAVDIT